MVKLHLLIIAGLLTAVVNAQESRPLEFSSSYNKENCLTTSVNNGKPETGTVLLESSLLSTALMPPCNNQGQRERCNTNTQTSIFKQPCFRYNTQWI